MSHLTESLAKADAPPHILAGLQVLQFQTASSDLVTSLVDNERIQFLEWCDARQLTLLLPHVCGSQLPAWLNREVMQKTARYESRFKRMKQELFEIVEAFDAAKLEFVMLKGLSHAPAFTSDARLRAQGDIDLWLLGSSVYEAQDVLSKLGYIPLLNSKSRHLAPMGRPSNWTWRGDPYDPKMPISVELHYELWSEQSEYIAVPQLQQFWDRKQLRNFDGRQINVLRDEDLLAFAALHLLLHLLHGELPLQRAWELGRFLDTHADDELFWTSWRNLHPLALRQVETIIFSLVTEWFNCRRNQGFDADAQLPEPVKSWLEQFSRAPLINEWKPNKSDVWLHLALVGDIKDKARVLLRRLIPVALPSFNDHAISRPAPAAKALAFFRQRRLIKSRIVRHLVTFFPTLFAGLRWFRVRK